MDDFHLAFDFEAHVSHNLCRGECDMVNLVLNVKYEYTDLYQNYFDCISFIRI